AEAARRFYGDPTAELQVVAITGTNGKTTTAFLLRSVLEAAGMRTGLLGTVTSIVGGHERPVERTTPEAIDLQDTFSRMLRSGDRACAMEVSSHALALHRTGGVRFACRVFTNLTQDHLDFHADMEDYFAAKRRLFEGPGGTAIVNYPHTPDSLANVLRTTRDLASGRLHVVFGAGGDRDRTKRPLMGRAAAALADRAIVTSDNPRSEDPDAIIAEIVAGMPPGTETEP